MSDGGLRELERRWAQTGDAGDREALERARARARGISPGVRRLAEWLRDGRARWEETRWSEELRVRWSTLGEGGAVPFVLVELSGVIWAASLGPLVQLIDELEEGARLVFLGLSRVRFLANEVLPEWVELAVRLRRRGGGVVLLRVPEASRRVLEEVGMDAFFGMRRVDLDEAATLLERGCSVERLAQDVFGVVGLAFTGAGALEELRSQYHRTRSGTDGRAFYRALWARDAPSRARLRAAAWLGSEPAQVVLREYDASLSPPRGPRWPWGRSLASTRIDAECGLALAQGRFDAGQLEEGVVGLRGPEAPSRWLLVFGEVRWRGSLEAIAEVLRGFAAERGVCLVDPPWLESFELESVGCEEVLRRLESGREVSEWAV